MKVADMGPSFIKKKLKVRLLERPYINMEDAIVKQDDQTTWYENDQLIEEYLESFKKPSTTEEVRQKEKLSLLKLLKISGGKHSKIHD